MLLVVIFDQIAVILEYLDRLPGGFLEGKVLPLGQVKHLPAEDSPSDDLFDFVGHIGVVHGYSKQV